MNKLQNVFVQNQNFILGRTQLFDWKLPEWKCCNICSWEWNRIWALVWFGWADCSTNWALGWGNCSANWTHSTAAASSTNCKVDQTGKNINWGDGRQKWNSLKVFYSSLRLFLSEAKVTGGRGSSSMEGRDIRPLGTRNPRFLRPAGNPVEIIWNLHWPCKV